LQQAGAAQQNGFPQQQQQQQQLSRGAFLPPASLQQLPSLAYAAQAAPLHMPPPLLDDPPSNFMAQVAHPQLLHKSC